MTQASAARGVRPPQPLLLLFRRPVPGRGGTGHGARSGNPLLPMAVGVTATLIENPIRVPGGPTVSSLDFRSEKWGDLFGGAKPPASPARSSAAPTWPCAWRVACARTDEPVAARGRRLQSLLRGSVPRRMCSSYQRVHTTCGSDCRGGKPAPSRDRRSPGQPLSACATSIGRGPAPGQSPAAQPRTGRF